MGKRSNQTIVACLVPVLILLWMCVTPLYTLLNGAEITLQTKPLDPSDVFRGDYVNLRYNIEEIPTRLVEKTVQTKLESGRNGLTVYVSLEKRMGVHVPVNVSFEKPKKGVYLKGTANYIGTEPTMNQEELNPSANTKQVVFIEYSLDKYFVEDNKGTKWEQASTKGEILAKVKVHNGYAILTDIEAK